MEEEPDDASSSGDDNEGAPDGTASPNSSVEKLCRSLFQWTCVNCTRPNAVRGPTAALLEFAAAVERRLLQQRAISMMRMEYNMRVRQYSQAVEARRDAELHASSVHASHVHMHFTSSAPSGGSASVVFDAASVSSSATGSRGSVLASMAQAIGLAPVAPALADLPPLPSPPPPPPDFAALEQALPPVPPVPDVPHELLEAQTCKQCDAPFCEASPSANGAVVARLQRLADEGRLRPLYRSLGHHGSSSGSEDGGSDEEEEDGGDGWAERAAAGAPRLLSPAPLPLASVPNTNMSVLGITLQDEDPDEYICRFGLTPEAIGAILSGPGCACTASRYVHAAGAPAAAACRLRGPGAPGDDDAALASSASSSTTTETPAQPGSEPASIHQQRLGSLPLTQRFERGFGGFAPVTAIVYDDRMLLHEEVNRPPRAGGAADSALLRGVPMPSAPVSMHPERPDRLRSIAQHLVATGLFQRCKRLAARHVTDEELRGVHDAEYRGEIDALDNVVEAHHGDHHFGSDTFANGHTLTAAKLACGSVVAVTEAVMSGGADRALALVRPPGHHAEPDSAMGFCVYNNVAVAAWVATRKLGAKRVLLVDWDVHHGNGTQHMFESDPSVLYVSLHRYDNGTFYPGTGGVHEVGEGPGAGYNINVPWNEPGMGDAEYALAFDEVIMPVAHAYAPDLVLVSAGFDAARGDPLGGCDLTPAGYAHMTHRLLGLAGGRVVVALEGGYNLTSISRGMEAVARVLLGQAPPALHTLPHRVHAAAGTEDSSSSGSSIDGTAGALPASSSSSSSAASAAAEACARAAAVPRADVFTPTSVDKEHMEALFDGADRDAALGATAASRSAIETIAQVLQVQRRYWPGLNAKYRGFRAMFQEGLPKGEGAAAAFGAGLPAGFTRHDRAGDSDGSESGNDDEQEEDADAASLDADGEDNEAGQQHPSRLPVAGEHSDSNDSGSDREEEEKEDSEDRGSQGSSTEQDDNGGEGRGIHSEVGAGDGSEEEGMGASSPAKRPRTD